MEKFEQIHLPGVTDDEIVLYSTGCPKCKILETKLKNKGIYYTKNTSIEDMISRGFTNVPVLKVNEIYLDFGDAVKWINALEV